MNIFRYNRGAERPIGEIWWFDKNGALIDFSAGYSFRLRIGHPNRAALVEKTSGITGAVGAGEAPGGTPNVTIVWDVDELDIPHGTYEWVLTATMGGGLDREISGPFQVAAGVLAAA